MNKAGKKFLEETARDFKIFKKALSENDQKKLPDWSWTHGQVQERLLRLGVEVAEFDIEEYRTREQSVREAHIMRRVRNDNASLQDIAIATLRCDMMGRNKQSVEHCDGSPLGYKGV